MFVIILLSSVIHIGLLSLCTPRDRSGTAVTNSAKVPPRPQSASAHSASHAAWLGRCQPWGPQGIPQGAGKSWKTQRYIN
jgi:hypothetical protein